MNTLITPSPLELPSGSASVAGTAARGWLARAGASFWHWLEASGRARGQRELLERAARYEATQPELAKELRAACGHAP
jgi:hypothetical protein